MTEAGLRNDALHAIRVLAREGQRAQAEQACESLLNADPGDVEACMLLAALRLDRGAPELACAALRQAVALAPRNASARLQLAVAQFRSAQRPAARATLDELLAVQPDDAVAWFHLGLLDEDEGDDPAARRCFSEALALRPDYRDASIRLGLLLQRRGDHAAALQELLRAWHPRQPELAEPIARALLETGDPARAAEFAAIAIDHAPGRATGWLLRGIALRERGHALAARGDLQRAQELAPENPLVLCELGCNARDLGEFARGQQALAAARRLAPAWHIPRWLHDLGLPTLAADEVEARDAVAAHARGIDALIADIEADAGEVRRTALDGLSRSLPFALHYLPLDTTGATRRFGDLVDTVVGHTVDDRLRSEPGWRALAHGGRLRVGFVSCELREHTVMRYFGGWLDGLDRGAFELHAWHLGAVRDAVSERVATQVASFHHVPTLPTPDIAARIRSAQLDVLVYLEVGMDPRPQLLAALRLAPVQCAAYGHPASTGLRTVDWFLSGDAMEPAGAEAHYRERLERLPGLGVEPARPPPPGDGSWLPRVAGRPLLLCLQSLFKLVPEFDLVLARIAAATDAQLVFFESPAVLSARFLERLGRRFAAFELDVARHVRILARTRHADYLGGIAASDLVLDSIGFSGGATSLDALSVGTPVVTLEGGFMRGRQTAAMLRMLGAEELVAADADGYVECAIALCRDAARREAMREQLRRRAPALFTNPEVLPALQAFLFRVARESAARRTPPA